MTWHRANAAPAVLWEALGAKAGGGLTYLRNVLPLVIASLPDSAELTVLAGDQRTLEVLPPSVTIRWAPRASRSRAARILFGQIVLPFTAARHDAVVFASGSHSSIAGGGRTVVLVRNTVYFDRELLDRMARSVRLRRRAEGLLILLSASRSRAVVYPSETTRGLVESSAGVLRSRIRRRGIVAPYGVDPLFLRRDGGRPSNDVVTFMSPSSATVQKNIGTVIAALVVARTRGIAVKVRVTFTIDDLPDALRGQVLDSRLVEEGYLDLLGRIPSSSIAEHLKTSDGCLLLSLSESFGQPAVEAMAIGCPVLAADRPWAREVCGHAAFYVDPLDAEALSDAFASWSDSKPAPLPLDEVRDQFSWAKHASVIAHLLWPGKSESA